VGSGMLARPSLHIAFPPRPVGGWGRVVDRLARAWRTGTSPRRTPGRVQGSRRMRSGPWPAVVLARAVPRRPGNQAQHLEGSRPSQRSFQADCQPKWNYGACRPALPEPRAGELASPWRLGCPERRPRIADLPPGPGNSRLRPLITRPGASTRSPRVATPSVSPSFQLPPRKRWMIACRSRQEGGCASTTGFRPDGLRLGRAA